MDTTTTLAGLVSAILGLVLGFVARHFGHLVPWLKDLLAKETAGKVAAAPAGYRLIEEGEYQMLMQRAVYVLTDGTLVPPLRPLPPSQSPPQ